MTAYPPLRRYTVIVVLIAVFAMLGACGDKAPDLPSDSNPANIHRLITGPDGDQFLNDVSRHTWGSESLQAATLFAWIGPDASSADPETRRLAAETAYAIATFLADNSHSLTGTGAVGKEDIGSAAADVANSSS